MMIMKALTMAVSEYYGNDDDADDDDYESVEGVD